MQPLGNTGTTTYHCCMPHICTEDTAVSSTFVSLNDAEEISPAPRWSRRRKGPPRNGGNPMPNTAPISPSTGEEMIPSCRHSTASFTNLNIGRGRGGGRIKCRENTRKRVEPFTTTVRLQLNSYRTVGYSRLSCVERFSFRTKLASEVPRPMMKQTFDSHGARGTLPAPLLPEPRAVLCVYHRVKSILLL